MLLLSCLFLGFLGNGLRDPQAATPVLCGIWLAAFLGPRPTWRAIKPWLFFLAWCVLSLLASPEPFTGMTTLARWSTLAIFFSLAVSQWGEIQRRQWFWGLAFCSMALAVAAVCIDIPSYPGVGLMPYYYNYTCFVEAAFLCAAFAAFWRADGLKGPLRWAAAGLAAAAAWEICWAHSRGALVAAAAGIGLFLWRNSQRRRLIPAAAVIAAALVAGLIWTSVAKIQVSQSFKRPQIWKAAFECTLDHPILGCGPGQFANAFLRHNFPVGYGIGNYRARTDHAHSEVMEAAAEFGLPGIILLLAAIAACLKAGRPEDSSWTREAGLAAWAGMSVQCLADNMFQLPALGLLYVSALAVAREPDPGPVPVERSLWRGLTLAGFLLAALSWIPGWALQNLKMSADRSIDPERRLELLLQAARMTPADPYLRENLYGALLSQKPPLVEESLNQLALAERLNPFNAVYPEMRASLFSRSGDWRRVLDDSSRAVALEPDYLKARLTRGEALLGLGRRDEARAEMGEIGRRMPFLRPHLNKGSGYESFILGFDRVAYEDMKRQAGR